MKKIVQLIQSVKGRRQNARQRRKTRAQSLVEFAITLPVLILLFAGLVEFGFALNFYLSLMDATREAARFASNWDPFLRDDPIDPNIVTGDDMTFYDNAITRALLNLDPWVGDPTYQGRRIILDPARDDILVTVFFWSDAGGVIRYPASGTVTLYHNRPSRFSDADIASRFEAGSPNAGLVLVEVHYNYRKRLLIPFLTDYLPGETIFMRAYTIMPLSAIQ
jgi:hypothetical protein